MRLDPLSIPYRAVQGGLQAIVGIVVAGVFGAGSVGGTTGLAIFGVVVVLGVGVALVWQVAYFRRFEYRLTADTFDIDSGVLSRREREIPYTRIQNVDITQNVVQRVLGIAEVRLETAGGGQTEARLRYVSYDEAERLQEEVSRRKRQDAGETTEADTERPESQPLFEITPRELAVLGVVSMDARLLSLLALPLSFAGPSVYAEVLPEGDLLWLFVPLAIVGTLLATAAVSGVLAITRYYDFTLVATDDEYRYERGLLQRFSGSIPKTKVQTITIKENLIARWLGYASMTIETAGAAGTGQEQSNTSQSAIPIARRERVSALAKRIEPFESLSFVRPPKRARLRYAARYAIAVTVVVALVAAAALAIDWGGPWYAVLALYALVPPAAHLKWANRGYRLEDDHVITRNGFWSRQIAVVPAYRIQTIATSATIFQRRRSLATVVVDTAGAQRLGGSDPKAVDIDAEVAEQMREELADDLQRTLAVARKRRRQRDHTEVPS